MADELLPWSRRRAGASFLRPVSVMLMRPCGVSRVKPGIVEMEWCDVGYWMDAVVPGRSVEVGRRLLTRWRCGGTRVIVYLASR